MNKIRKSTETNYKQTTQKFWSWKIVEVRYIPEAIRFDQTKEIISKARRQDIWNDQFSGTEGRKNFFLSEYSLRDLWDIVK